MFNPIAILFAIIDIQEPPVTEDDTVEFQPVAFIPEPPVMRTHPITAAPLLDVTALRGCLVAYRMTTADNWQLGNIRAIEETRFGIKALFTPKDTNLPEKWRFLNELNYAWME
jgi:hypothetical protein